MKLTGPRLTAVGALILAVLLYLAGRTATMPRAYLFPNILALAMIGLAVYTLVSEWVRLGTPAATLVGQVPWGTLAPALIILGGYVYLLPRLGFYTTSLALFIILVLVYSPPRRLASRFLLPIALGLIFMLVIYGLFAVLLHVLAPAGLFM